MIKELSFYRSFHHQKQDRISNKNVNFQPKNERTYNVRATFLKYFWGFLCQILSRWRSPNLQGSKFFELFVWMVAWQFSLSRKPFIFCLKSRNLTISIC